MNFDHVQDEHTLRVLRAERPTEKELCEALEFAGECLSADEEDEDVSIEVWNARAEALDDVLQGIEGGDLIAAHAALRKFWSV